jgi:DNA-binding CsgD family transcriptional regulator/pimeloyl-ACP methyl ester carboxylesterase
MDAPPVRYVRSNDGFNIAYTVCGEGPPYIYMPHIAHHVQLSWGIPERAAWLQGLASKFTLISYDSRGQGLSTRGLSSGFSISDLVRDLEAVVRHLELRDFVLDAQRFFGHVALRFAAAHPQDVRALVLKHCALEERANSDAQRELAREDWHHYLTLVTGMLGGDRGVMSAFLGQAHTQADWLTLVDGIGISRIDDFLPDLKVPTLLLHQRGFTGLKEEDAVRLAARIANARLVLTEGTSLIIDAAQGLQAVDVFLKDVPVRTEAPSPPHEGLVLSHRELEVLRLIAAGKSNPQIADELVISLNTVQRHVSNILAKTGLSNRTEAASFATRNGLV